MTVVGFQRFLVRSFEFILYVGVGAYQLSDLGVFLEPERTHEDHEGNVAGDSRHRYVGSSVALQGNLNSCPKTNSGGEYLGLVGWIDAGVFDVYEDPVRGEIFQCDYDSLRSVYNEVATRVKGIFSDANKIVRREFGEQTDSGFEHDW